MEERGYFLIGLYLSLFCIAKTANRTKCTTTVGGKEYLGIVNVTAGNKPCLPWSQIAKFKGQERLFPDCSIADASNYCRNPYDIANLMQFPYNIRPACYFTQPNGQPVWSYCNVPHCDLPSTATTCFSAKRSTTLTDSKLCQCKILVRTVQPAVLDIMQVQFEYKIKLTGTCDRQVEVTIDGNNKTYLCDGSTYTRSMTLMILYWVEKLEFQKNDTGDSEYAIKVTGDESIAIESCGNKNWNLGAGWDVKYTKIPAAAPPSKSMCPTSSTAMATTEQTTPPSITKIASSGSSSEVIVAAALGATLGVLLILIFIVISCLSCRRTCLRDLYERLCRWHWKQTAEFPIDDLASLDRGQRNFTYSSPSLELQDDISNGDLQYDWPHSNGKLTTSTFKANVTDSSILSDGTIYKTSRPEETTNYGYFNPADIDYTGSHPAPDYEEVNLSAINPRLIDENGYEVDAPILYTTVLKGNMKNKDVDNNNAKSVTFSKFSTFKTFT